MNGREKIVKHHSILYCPISKIGTKFFGKVLQYLVTNSTYASQYNDNGKYGHKIIQKIEKSRELNDMQHSAELNVTTAFMFVRNPYARLFSAYVDKIYTPNFGMGDTIGREAATTVRNYTKDSNYKHDITFREFVQYILKLDKDHKTIDGHFRPMSDHCDACAVPYTFIGQLETLQDDVSYLMNQWRNEFPYFKFKFNDFEKESAIHDARYEVGKLFFNRKYPDDKNFPFYNKSVRIWCSLQIRGIISKHSRFPFTKNKATMITKDRFTAALMDALENRKDISAIKDQRTEAYIQAYHTIPLTEMRQLREYVLKDCKLFGYDDSPKELFDRNVSTIDHLYLDGL
ncbi:carbohydrate sulfotransferase 9-like [Mya arenaria]|uniref:carbohydrate sulfotransferase 9-like n=1 Tax=Mya arenaria TaxID=6604 RepID=UPI0022E86C90|nr:carbohydrate sulfotransferase 9-like [Mya arenaria]